MVMKISMTDNIKGVSALASRETFKSVSQSVKVLAMIILKLFVFFLFKILLSCLVFHLNKLRIAF